MNKMIEFTKEDGEIIALSLGVIGSIEKIDDETTMVNHSQGGYFKTKSPYAKVIKAVTSLNSLGNEQIIQYRMASGINVTDLLTEVNGLLATGYQPYGSPFFKTDPHRMCQAMVKRG